MVIRGLIFGLLFLSVAVRAQVQPPAAQPFDSMAYYNSTKKPAINLNGIIEYAPTIQADGKKMIFQRAGEGKKYDLYESSLNGSAWGEFRSLDGINKSSDSTELVGGPSISFDGNVLYFFRSVGMNGNHDIFYSERTKDGWGPPQSIGSKINTDPVLDRDKKLSGGYEAFPSVSADGSTLYFVRTNEEGPQDKTLRKSREGLFCLSIYKSDRQADGTWGKPDKLPWPINQDCEKAPRIMADGRTLIFSSNRPGGKGGYDMYQSKLNAGKEWSMPVPLNYVNTEMDEQLPCISAAGDLMYYTYDNNDIYSVVIPPNLRQFMNNIVQGYVTDEDSNTGIAAKVVVTDALTSEPVMTMDNNEADGRYTLVLPVGRSFNIEFRSEGHSSYTYSMDLRDVKKYEERMLDVQLFRTVKVGLVVSDREIFEPVMAEVKVKERGKSTFLSDIKIKSRDGSITLDLPVGKDYEIIVNAPNFKSEIRDFNFSGLVIYRNFNSNVDLEPEKKQVMVNVSDVVNNSKVKARVLLKNKNREEVIEVTGNQMVSLRAGDRYEMEVTSDQGYAFNSTTVDLTKGEVEPVDIKLMKLEVDAKLALRDINFESNSFKLSDVSFVELRRVVKLMQENPSLRVEVAAHTDDIGSEVNNRVLSDQRAKSVSAFLNENNISPERFVAKGYGESQSKVPNINETNRAINRRVELKILGI